MTTNMTSALSTAKQRIEQQLNQYITQLQPIPSTLQKALNYTVLAGGKRLRPLLVYATGHCLGATLETLDPPAVAIELIHTYSLIHDDLPCMDDDDLRRGKPTCHKAFNEATAILVGDALQSLAFEILATKRHKPNTAIQCEMMKVLAVASGAKGMVGGQQLDLEAEGQTRSLDEVEKIHALKTSALIRASVRMGALAAGCTHPEALACLDQYAQQVGLAFQIQDDILDIEGHATTTGKPVGSDASAQKATFPLLTSVAQAKQKVSALVQSALTSLGKLPYDTSELAQLARQMTDRQG